jgi:hypothetical protein
VLEKGGVEKCLNPAITKKNIGPTKAHGNSFGSGRPETKPAAVWRRTGWSTKETAKMWIIKTATLSTIAGAISMLCQHQKTGAKNERQN